MISVAVALADYMDATPVTGARVSFTVHVVPRWTEVLPELPDADPVPPVLRRRDPGIAAREIGGNPPRPTSILQPEWSLAAQHQVVATSGSDGRASAGFDVRSDFARLARAVSPSGATPPQDVVAVLTVRVQSPPLDREMQYQRGLVVLGGPGFTPPTTTDLLGPDSSVQHTIAIDFAKAIVGHTTPTSTTLWFQLHGDPAASERYVCEIEEHGGGPSPQRIPITFAIDNAKTAVAAVDGLRAATRYRYALRVIDGAGSERALATGSVRTAPASSRTLEFAFASCHLPTSATSLERWQRLARRDDYEFLLLTGDQIYGDGLDKYTGGDWLEKYIDLYDRFWGEWPMREVMRRTPTYMILDDHEIDDDYGVVTGDSERDAAGMRAYRIFQQAHNPGGIDGPLHYSFRWGPAAFFMLDNRSARVLPDDAAGVAHPVLGQAQADALVQWAGDPDTLAADFAFVIAPVPIAFLPVHEVMRLIEEVREAAENAGATGGGLFGAIVGGIVGGIVAGPPGIVAGAAIGGTLGAGGGHYIGQELADDKIAGAGLGDMTTRDLADMWTYADNQRDLVTVLDTLFDLGNDVGGGGARARAMFLLGGDVHSGSMHRVRSRRTAGAEGRHARNPIAFQLISSAISQHPATDKTYEKVVRHIRNDVSITTGDLVGAGFDFDTLAGNVFGEANANFALDDQLGTNYAADIVDFVAERNFGRLRIEPAGGSRVYDVHAWIEGPSKTIRRGFRLSLDAPRGVEIRDLYGGLAVAEGRVALLRAHAPGSGFGPASDPVDADAIVSLDSDPARFFGLRLRPGAGGPVATAEFDMLRSALSRGSRVRIEYIRTGYRNGMVHRVMELA